MKQIKKMAIKIKPSAFLAGKQTTQQNGKY